MISAWVAALLLLLGIIIVFKLVKGFFKALVYAFLLLVVALAIVSFIVIRDAGSFTESFFGSDKLLLLEHEGEIISGSFLRVISSDEKPAGLIAEELAHINSIYNPKNLSSIHENGTFLMLMSYDFLEENLPGSVEFGGSLSSGGEGTEAAPLNATPAAPSFSRQELLDAILSEQPSGLVAEKSVQEPGSDAQKEMIRSHLLEASTEEDIRAELFLLAFSSILEERGFPFLVKEMKEGNLRIYPDNSALKAARLVPGFILDWVSNGN